jgi:hypothetical protein
MATTYTLISSVAVGAGGTSDIEFTSIPNTYTDLQLFFSTRDNSSGSSGNNIVIKLNGSASLLDEKAILGTGTSVLPLSNSDSAIIYVYGDTSLATSNTFGNTSLYITNYAGSNFKSISIDGVTENNATAALQLISSALFKSTSAVTSITLSAYNFASFVQHSTADLYGISNA